MERRETRERIDFFPARDMNEKKKEKRKKKKRKQLSTDFTSFELSRNRDRFYSSPEAEEEGDSAAAAAAAAASVPPSFFSASLSACLRPITMNRFVKVRRLSAPPWSQSTSARIFP